MARRNPSGSPPISWSVSEQNGQWTLVAERQSARRAISAGLSVQYPLDVGRWHDVTMQIGWSVSDSDGFVELWHNGFVRRSPTAPDLPGAPMVPGTDAPSVYYKGYYRENGIEPTGVVYHPGSGAQPPRPGCRPDARSLKRCARAARAAERQALRRRGHGRPDGRGPPLRSVPPAGSGSRGTDFAASPGRRV